MIAQTRSLVDPELLSFLGSEPPLVLTSETLAATRAAPAPLASFPEQQKCIVINERYTDARPDAPPVKLLIIEPQYAAAGRGCIYHVHGGGYVSGSAERATAVDRWLAAQLGCTIVSVDYRLAPETHFPGNIEDCYAGLSWTFENAKDLGINPSLIGVMGESAGGGLAASLALLARDRGDHRLAFQHLIYPMIDDRTGSTSDPHPFAGEHIWTPQSNRFGWAALLGHEPGGEGVSPYAAAARATDLSDLPPTFISTGALDLFLEEDIDFGRRLIRDGVPVEMHVYPGAYHAFDFFVEAAVSRQAWADALRSLARNLNTHPDAQHQRSCR